jgi:hypothetical protein
MDSLLIGRLGAVGDGLLLAPALASLRAAYPHARIDVTGFVWRLRLLEGPALASSVRPLDDLFIGESVNVPVLDAYDRIELFAVDPEAPVVRAIVDAVPQRAAGYPSFPITTASGVHVADHVHRSLSHLGIPAAADRRFTLPLAATTRRLADPFLSTTADGRPRAYLAPGTRIDTKRWPAPRFAALAGELLARGWQVYLGCGPVDGDVYDAVSQAIGPLPVVPAIGQDLLTTAALLARMQLCVGVDSGITHLAAMVGTPTIALYGPTRPELWGPIGPALRVMRKPSGLACCDDDHPRRCQGGCMNRIDVSDVLAAIAQLVDDRRG